MTPETAVPIKATILRSLERSSDAIPGHPRIDMIDLDDRLIIKTELSGVERNDIDLRLQGRDLVIYRARHDGDDVKDDDRSRAEPAPGAILHRIPMPFCVAAEDVQAKFDDSLLCVEVRRPAHGPNGEKIIVR